MAKRKVYWRTVGAPPALPTGYDTDIYPANTEMGKLQDYDLAVKLAVMQIKDINIDFVEKEPKGFVDNKGKGFLKLQAKYGDTPGYFWICSEHQKMHFFIVKHNHKLSFGKEDPPPLHSLPHPVSYNFCAARENLSLYPPNLPVLPPPHEF